MRISMLNKNFMKRLTKNLYQGENRISGLEDKVEKPEYSDNDKDKLIKLKTSSRIYRTLKR